MIPLSALNTTFLLLLTLNFDLILFSNIDISILENKIRSKLRVSNNKKVVLRADKGIKYGKVIIILDILRKIENIKIGVSTES